MRSVVISSGHGKYVRGASGVIDEVDEARLVVDEVARLLDQAGALAGTFHDNTSTTQSENLERIVDYHNSRTRDLDVSIHFNAYETTSRPMGVEVLYVTQEELASALSGEMATMMDLPDRGGKYRSDLYFLNNTTAAAILIETCFCDSSADAEAYRNSFNTVCRVIADMVGDLASAGPPLNPPEWPERPGAGAHVSITIRSRGAVTVTINGQDFQVPPPVDPPARRWMRDIETTVFGGESDPNDSAYPPYEFIDDSVMGVALPWTFEGERPLVIVRNRENNRQAMASIVDKGPWMITDDYWDRNARPVAETCYHEGRPLPSGPHAGEVPGNGAGLDITPAVAAAIGIDGKGWCDWAFQ